MAPWLVKKPIRSWDTTIFIANITKWKTHQGAEINVAVIRVQK